MTRTEIIQHLIDIRGYKSYLEIGSFRNENFIKIRIDKKTSVDPDPDAYANYKMTSDQYFAENKDKFDIYFIDGLHQHDQVWRDIRNSLEHLNNDGIIVLHDCLPKNERMQIEDFKSHQHEEWTGDVWKAYYKAYSELQYKVQVVDTDYGCGIIDTKFLYPEGLSWKVRMEDLKYDDFLRLRRDDKFGVISVAEFLERYK
jgi:hypothetical protein